MAAPSLPSAARPPAPDVASPSAAPSESESARLQAAIAERASRFTLGALLDALRYLGYEDHEIEYRSRATTAHQSSLVAAVEWRQPPQRGAVVVLNLGLLGPQSLLPWYFRRVLDKQVEGGLAHFLNYFSGRLLRSVVKGQFPERDEALFPDWTGSLGHLRALLGLGTLSTVHWLFEQVYPELGVAVKRVTLYRSVRSRGVRIGDWAMGDGAVLGAVAQVPVSGIGVKLLSDEAVSGSGQPWAKEAEARLGERVFPILARHGIHLEVSLILRDQRSFLVLKRDQFLGYAPIYGGPATGPQPRSVRTIILWNGAVPES